MIAKRLIVIATAVVLMAVPIAAAGNAKADPSPGTSASSSPSVLPSSPPSAPANLGVISPANISQCSFGDNFYEFVSDYAYLDHGYYNGQIVGADAIVKLNIDTDGSWFCQVGYEWMDLTGNNLCLTLNYNQNQIDVITCQGLASQEWQLIDNDGSNALGVNYGGLQSFYNNHGTLYMAMNSTEQSAHEQWFCCWNDNDIYGYTLDGPYHF